MWPSDIVLERPERVLGRRFEEVQELDWQCCWPVFDVGVIVGVISRYGETYAGPFTFSDLHFDPYADCFQVRATDVPPLSAKHRAFLRDPYHCDRAALLLMQWKTPCVHVGRPAT